MNLSQIKALRKDVTDTLLNLTATTYKDGKEHSNWIDFLKSNMFTYKYPFAEQLQIHTQTKDNDTRPRAVADMKIWNRFGYKLKDSEAKAISITDLDNITVKSSQTQLYDISQLERKDGRDEEIPFKLWDKSITLDIADRLKTALMEKYDIEPSEDREISLNTVLLISLEKNFKRILDENDTKFAVGENMSERVYGEIGFAAFVSAQIMIIARLGSKAGFTNEDVSSFYKMIYDYLPRINTKETITALGEMTNTFAKEMFAEIEIEVKKIERELKIASKGELNHEQIKIDSMGKNASGISEGVQASGVSEVDQTGAVAPPLHRDTEPNAGLHREHEESNVDISNRYGANARQSGEPDRMDAGDEPHRADSERNSNQGSDRGQLVDEKEESIVETSVDKKVLITNITDYDPDIYGKPWVSAVSRGKNYFTTKDGEPIGEYTGNAESGEGGGIYVINPQEGRIYGHGLKNKQDNSKSLIAYVKYQDGNFLPCDRKGNMLAVNTGADKSIELEQAEDKEAVLNTTNEETAKQTAEPTQTQSPTKSEWEIFIEERSTGVFAQQYTEPVVIIEFSENANFGGENSLDSQAYEELSFTQADRKFKDVEIEVRADQIKRNGELGGYDKTYGVILYKGSPEDTDLSTYDFRYDIGDYNEKESGLFNHIKGFWDYQEKTIQKGEFTVYKQENIDNVKRMLSILEPYTAQAIETQLQKNLDKPILHQETRPIGETVLMPFLYKNGSLVRDGKRSYATIEKPIGKYQIYSHEIGTEKYASIMTDSGKLIDISDFNRLLDISYVQDGDSHSHSKAIINGYKPDIEKEIDKYLSLLKDSFEEAINDPNKWVDYQAAALVNRIDEAITHNDPIIEARRKRREEENIKREEERKQEEQRLAEEKAIREDLGGFGDEGNMTPLQKSKAVAFLKDERYVTREYGSLSNKEFVEKILSEGYLPQKRVSLKKKYADMDISDYNDFQVSSSYYGGIMEVKSRQRQIAKDNLGIDSPQGKWLKEHSPLTYYKTFKNNELAETDKDFLESPEMKPYVNTEYVFSKPLEQDGHFSTYAQGIAKTHFDYAEFLLKSNSVIREKNSSIEATVKPPESSELQEEQNLETEAPQKSMTAPTSGIFATVSDSNINVNVKGKYSDTHFRIEKNGYDYNNGWTNCDEATRRAYKNEIDKIFVDNGWSLQESDGNGSVYIAIKGRSQLYLHPQDFSGVCENSEREALFESLGKANTFLCRAVDVYEEIHDMTDEELTERLNNKRETIENELLEAFTTKRSNLYITNVGHYGVSGNIGKRYGLKRLAIEGEKSFTGVDNRTEGICSTFVGEIFKSLVDSGKIVSSKTRNGMGYRTANKDELKHAIENQMHLSDFSFKETQQTKMEDNTDVTAPAKQAIEEQIFDELSSRGFITSDELIADGLSDALSHGVPYTFEDIADFIENEYLAEEPEFEQAEEEPGLKHKTAEISAESKKDYAVGDTVYLERFNNVDKYIIKEITDKTVKIIDASHADPIVEELNIVAFNNLYYSNPMNKADTKEAELPEAQTEPEPPQNYRLNEQILNRTSFGEKTRFKENIEAIKILKFLEAESRTATKDEQEILSKYVGWGGISQAFNTNNPSWSSEYTELKELLTEQEYREAQASTLSAFYTNPTVIKAMYEALENIGITSQVEENDKLNILEPALGVGNFFGVMPEELQRKSHLQGIELDSISARIAQNLYPRANIQNTGYEETYAKDYFDIILGNVPFGDFKVIDKQNPEIAQHGFRIHDHFFGKALDQVRPGGVVAFITSSGTMDKEATKTRRYIAERAELLGAVRLPNNAFKGIANTEVTSDIIFLQKRSEPLNLTRIKEQAEKEGKDGEEAVKQLCPWVFTEKVSGINKINGEDVPINSYFVKNPQMVLGEMIIDNGNRMHGALIPSCKPFEGMDLSEQLKDAVTELKSAEAVQVPTQGYIGTFEVHKELSSDVKEWSPEPPISYIPRNFSYVLGKEDSAGNRRIYFFETLGKKQEDVTDTFSDLQKERMTKLIGIKDTCRALIDAQLNNHSEEVIKGLQGELNSRYDEYTKKHGLINSRTAKQIFAEDSSYPLLCALEVLDTNGEFVCKSDMFSKRTINPIIEITSADTAEEALILSMSERGSVDVPYMEKLTGKTENELFSELIGLGKVYKDLRYPFGIGSYEYCTFDEYLSGNVRAKLSKAKTLLAELKELKTRFEDKDYHTKDMQIRYLAKIFDLDEKLLRELIALQVTERELNKFGRFDELMSTVDKYKAKIFFDKMEGIDIPSFRVNMKVSNLLREFVLKGELNIKAEDIGIDIDDKYNLETESGADQYAEIMANMETVQYNISALEKSIPKQLESSDIDVRFGSTWIPPHYIGDFIGEKLHLSQYTKEGLGVTYDKHTSTWGKNSAKTHVDRVLSTEVYGTTRIEAMDIMFDTLNLKDVKIYDTHPDDSKRRILNYAQTVLAQDIQKKIKKEFIDWIWDNPDRRADLVEIYNRQFNAIRPREYDGSNLRFPGMSPEVTLKPHQKDAVARILYGGNTLLAHEVGLGKTFEMIAAAMESKRLGLCNKSLVVVPKHLTEQFGADFLKVYPNANVLIVRENDFTPQNRKKFCAKIATGDYDAIVMAHSQFEKVPLSKERQGKFIQDQLDELEYENEAVKNDKDHKQFTVKQLEKRKKQLEAKLDELVNQEYKDDTIDFEELGIGKLFVDEAHFFKNLYFTTKLTNVAGLSKSESNRATDMFMKCRYLDEKTGNKGVTFATGTPMYTLQQ